MSAIDKIMSDVQSFACTWALVGSKLDDGGMYNTAETQSAELRELIASAIAGAKREGAEQIREEAADYAICDGRGSLAECIRAIPLPTGPRQAVLLTDEQIEHGRKQVFSTENPFCPCDAKTMRKAARWAESASLAANGLEVRRG